MIKVDNLRKAYGAHEVLKGVNLEVKAGEVVCIIGPSGSGKSTILRCMNGLETYQSGLITINGDEVHAQSKSIQAIRMEATMVFQRFNLFPHRTVLENVIEGPVYVKKVPRDEAVTQAKQLLETTRMSLDSITYKIGYEDSNSFRRLFLQRVGLLPAAYRKKFQTAMR